MELKDLLRHLGYIVTLEDTHRQMARLKVESPELDFREFLRLMRLHREEELQKYQKIFADHAGREGQGMTKERLSKALKAVGYDANSMLIRFQVMAVKDIEHLDFDTFVGIVDGARRASTTTKRRYAGFTEAEVESFRTAFKHYDKDGSGSIEGMEISDFLTAMGIQLRTVKDREHMFEKIDAARQRAKEAGVEDVELGTQGAGAPQVMFWTLVQLLRMLRNEDEEREERRENDILAKTRFTPAEADEFREIFIHWSVQSSKQAESGTGTAKPAPSGDSTRLSLDGLRCIVHSMGVRFQPTHSTQLQTKFNTMGLDQDKTIDFPDFLQMMRWMLDANFAGINDIAGESRS
eukprot:gnl/TRDRNA2_/TRDRNA2_82319_c2_seq1.p1 gnl/TRDRNA2_/TRDRNA2_82319_c2~~gnl/TRDRNA2_/TRDRNA2_82319_c2_seq1.p1  ORF type:complete len:365 (+),score=75.53 gnl/TRDRNA2_/TRDRNA2_82319_c2_seq1:46-1095(+)